MKAVSNGQCQSKSWHRGNLRSLPGVRSTLPLGSDSKTRKSHRGVQKIKINTSRCLPLVAQADGCSICMKVCPIQRYGLDAVLDEYERTGGILGNGTDELEGYDWPIDGKHYAIGERPSLGRDFFQPPGTDFNLPRPGSPSAETNS